MENDQLERYQTVLRIIRNRRIQEDDPTIGLAIEQRILTELNANDGKRGVQWALSEHNNHPGLDIIEQRQAPKL